jgi:hypothetical protein
VTEGVCGDPTRTAQTPPTDQAPKSSAQWLATSVS